MRAVRMFPKAHGFILNKRTCAGILNELKARNIPLFINLEETSWKEIDEFLSQYPDIPTIITGLSDWGDDRFFYPLLRDFRNLYLECCNYRIMGGLEAIIDRFGPERLVFGSGLPERAAGGPITMILYSGLSESDKYQIAYGNLKRLIDGVKV